MNYFTVIQSVMRYVETHPACEAAHIADALGYSEAHLRSVFARHTGVPLMRYITRRRAANAAFDMLYTGDSLLEIALKYGYEAYDTFTRSFRRVTGLTPSEFRAARPGVERRAMGGGMYGMHIAKQPDDMTQERKQQFMKHTDAHSTILYGIPQAIYGSYGGYTPYPICLKACANYMGEDIDYADAMVGCGAAFRMTWDTAEWDLGNVDVSHTFNEGSDEVYTQGMAALGRGWQLYQGASSKNEYKAFIKAALDKGMPIIAMGVVGPPEAGIIAGYRDDGNTLLGWSMFQAQPDYRDSVHLDDCGYYITDQWWENGVERMLLMGERQGVKQDVTGAVNLALRVMEPRMDGAYAKGLASYDAWKKDMLDDSAFAADENGMPFCQKLGWRVMCLNDAACCIADGRSRASEYFERRKAENPRYGELAMYFCIAARAAHEMFKMIEGMDRDEQKLLAVASHDFRNQIGGLIDRAREADEQAYAVLKALV